MQQYQKNSDNLNQKIAEGEDELKEEKEFHGNTKKELTNEKKDHGNTKKDLSQEKERHGDTKNELIKEKTGHGNTKQDLKDEQLGNANTFHVTTKKDLVSEKTNHKSTTDHLTTRTTDLQTMTTSERNAKLELSYNRIRASNHLRRFDAVKVIAPAYWRTKASCYNFPSGVRLGQEGKVDGPADDVEGYHALMVNFTDRQVKLCHVQLQKV